MVSPLTNTDGTELKTIHEDTGVRGGARESLTKPVPEAIWLSLGTKKKQYCKLYP